MCVGRSSVQRVCVIGHRLPDRIRAHAMICFLAIVLYRVMRMRLKVNSHSASRRNALDLRNAFSAI